MKCEAYIALVVLAVGALLLVTKNIN